MNSSLHHNATKRLKTRSVKREKTMPTWTKRSCRTLLLATAAFGVSAGVAMATPYRLLTAIAIPASADNVPVSGSAGRMQTYDIADVNPATNLVYLADRSNASVDIFNAQSLTFAGRIGGSTSTGGAIGFGGQQFSGSPPAAANGISGPDGLVVAPSVNQVFVGNGSQFSNTAATNANSTLYGFALGTNAPTTTTHTLGTGRVDELAFDPTQNRVLAVNNADSPPFLSFIDATTGVLTKKITFDGTNGTPNATTGGLEAPVYDPVTGKYYVAVPQIGTTGPGGLSEIDPTTGAVLRTFDFGTIAGLGTCSPTGTVAGNDGQILVGCGDTAATKTVLVDPVHGTLKAVNGIGGEDQVAYDTATNLYFTASRFQPGGPVLGIIDGNGNLLQTLATTPQDHSVTVDPNNGYVFVAAGGIAGNTICPNGCELVYAPVPEPSTLAITMTAVLGLFGLGRLGLRRG